MYLLATWFYIFFIFFFFHVFVISLVITLFINIYNYFLLMEGASSLQRRQARSSFFTRQSTCHSYCSKYLLLFACLFVCLFVFGSYSLQITVLKWNSSTSSLLTPPLLHLSVNPTSPRLDQHQFSPNNIYASSSELVIRINKMMFKGNMLWSFNISLN